MLSPKSKSTLKISKPEKKKIKALQNTTVAQIKHLIIESSTTIFKKLKIIGVGYRADLTSTLDEKLLILKLGFSHPVYVQIPNNLSLKCLTKTNEKNKFKLVLILKNI